jgi:hypothetical protein
MGQPFMPGMQMQPGMQQPQSYAALEHGQDEGNPPSERRKDSDKTTEGQIKDNSGTAGGRR